tara:strand:- start:6054 stop:6542 length:489 start_codon:yes stop_codon:yes gene_type:complete
LIKAEPESEIVVIRDSVKIFIDSAKTHKMFFETVGKFESGCDYKKVNRFGYLGKYQFSIKTVRGLGIDCSAQEFIDQPLLQEYAMEKYLLYNKKQLQDYIGKYQFKTYRGIYLTESGILAAAHLGGAGSVKKFFKGGEIFKDGNRVPITKYMTKFSGYNLKY